MPKKTTLYLGDEEFAPLKQASKQEGVSQEAIIIRALRTHLNGRVRKSKSIGAGRSGRGALSARAEDLLEGMREEA